MSRHANTARHAILALALLIALGGSLFSKAPLEIGHSRTDQQNSVARTSTVSEIASVGMTVADLDRSVKFYTDVLSFEPVATTELSGDPNERLSASPSPTCGTPTRG